MDDQRKEYTFFWYVENLRYCLQKPGEELVSPPFTADWLKGAVWNLALFPRGRKDDQSKGNFTLLLRRSAEDDAPESISIEFEISALSADGSLIFFRELSFMFKKANGRGHFEPLNIDEILSQRKTDNVPQDMLTVRCKIWKGKGNVHSTAQSSARTRIKVEKISFLQVVEKFSTLETKQKKTIQIRCHPKEERSISSSLHITSCSCCEEKIVVEIVPSSADQILLKCEISLLDASGNAIECGKADTRYDTEGKSIDKLPLSLTRAAILDRKSEYLPDGKLSLLCDCTFSSGIQFQDIEETLHEMPFPATKQKRVNTPRKNAKKVAEKLSAYPGALEDLRALYLNQSLADVQLKTKTKSFPAHKSVLCARSPVFTAMLVNNMKEKNTDCIQVDDLGDDVVEKLLLYLYSDTVENLEWQTATELYYAADKYQVGKLKVACSSFLVESLTPTTAGQLLLLADNHSDKDLKEVVEDFILEHEKEVFGSREWEMLMETNPVLVMKAMHLKYKR